jgi:endogenous inhibitor of DNA gyrase (YacG/DUF329 family)
MTKKEKECVRFLRGEGYGYLAIATRLGISLNTVKSFCRRNGLGGIAEKPDRQTCRQCGKPLAQEPKRPARKYCSEACRRIWWKEHSHLINKKAFYSLTCAHCGKEFQSYGNQKRKYCSHPCYIAARFGKAENDGETV